jgi:glycosyltransferase involved in cell wall biosynthesis
MSGALVSVITPFLNAEDFLSEAIESVLAQTYGDWELILFDDGSTDRGANIAREYTARFSTRIRYLSHPEGRHRGTSATRNAAIAESSGRFIAMLDADDVWLPHKLEEQIAIADAAAVDAVHGAPRYWRSWRETGELDTPPPEMPPPGAYDPPQLALSCYPLGVLAAPCPSDLLMRRCIFDSVGGFDARFTGSFRLYEDQVLLIKLFLSGRVFVSDECWTLYRLHENSVSANVHRKRDYWRVRTFFFDWLRGYVDQQRIEDPAVRDAIGRAVSKNNPLGRLEAWAARQLRRLRQ